MTDEELLALLDSTLGPTLSEAGFAEALGGWTGVTFCTGGGDFAKRFEWLPQAHPEARPDGRVDLEVEFDQTTGLLARVDLGTSSLAATLYATGQGAQSAELKAAYALPLPESLAAVVRALETVFAQPQPQAPDPEPAA